MTHSGKVKLVCGVLAAACFVTAGLLGQTRRTTGDLWEVLPGRAFVVNYLWIRMDRLKDEGRFYDAMQQAELIGRLQKHFPGVWSFLSWNMAWNISAATRTPEERWRWVYNGVRLLRDQGIPLNPNSIALYKDLGWIYLFKIGGYLDDMHWVYKRQWACRMQDLLGAPPEGTTAQVIAAFRPVADEALLDKDPLRQGTSVIQADKLAELLRDPAVAAYAKLLADAGLKIDQTFLGAYNQYTMDEAVRVVRVLPPHPQTPEAIAKSTAINDPAHAAARKRVLAFLRAQILWNVYRMDPAWMLTVMEKYGPMDWRLPQPVAIYWLALGQKLCPDTTLADVDALNNQRNIFISLKDLAWRGRLTMEDMRPRGTGEDNMGMEPVRGDSLMDLPEVRIRQFPDLRFVQSSHNAYMEAIGAMGFGGRRRLMASPLATGHINFLIGAVEMLYADRRVEEAQKLLDWVRVNYDRTGPEWAPKNVGDFVLNELRQDAQPTRDLAESQVGMSMEAAFVALSRGDQASCQAGMEYSRRAFDAYQKGRGERMKLPGFDSYLTSNAIRMVVNPRWVGYNLSLPDRAYLYQQLPAPVQQLILDKAGRQLKAECDAEGLDFKKAFPPPGGAAGAGQK
jgi:hypothetical protein